MIVLHPQTERSVAQFITQPSHAVLLTGTTGIGKGHVARHIITNLIGITESKLDSYQYGLSVVSDKSIGIEQIRGVAQFLSLKTAGTQSIRRFVLIERAETMTTEAQNAVLKQLEEPPSDTIFVLTSSQPHELLTTIVSRCQHITINKPTKAAILSIAPVSDKSEQQYALSGGLPGLYHALATGDEEHPLVQSIEQAKNVLRMTMYERLATIDTLTKQKTDILGLLDALQHIAEAGITQAAAKQSTSQLAKWHQVLQSTTSASEDIRNSGQAKLVLTHLFLSM